MSGKKPYKLKFKKPKHFINMTKLSVSSQKYSESKYIVK